MENFDVRWEQRFQNYIKALDKLSEAVAYAKKSTLNDEEQTVLNDLIKQGLIQSFEYTHELAWKVMKDYAIFQGNSTIGGSRDTVREALQLKIIADGHVWMEMIGSRNQTSHTYNNETANEIFDKIINNYYQTFVSFKETMENKVNV